MFASASNKPMTSGLSSTKARNRSSRRSISFSLPCRTWTLGPFFATALQQKKSPAAGSPGVAHTPKSHRTAEQALVFRISGQTFAQEVRPFLPVLLVAQIADEWQQLRGEGRFRNKP